MKLSFLSNYYNHHQRAICEAWDQLTNHQFCFIATEEFAQERKQMGWNAMVDIPFVKEYDDMVTENGCDQVDQADVVILGNAPLETVQKRFEARKTVFKYSERVFKNGYQPLKWLPRVYRYWQRYGRHESLYLLCASAYTAVDYAIHGTFVGKRYKWGYFPETKRYDIDRLLTKKNPTKILWCGRFLDWKHPDDAVEVARRLKGEGYSFELDLIGTGEMEDTLKKMVCDGGMTDCVRLLGPMSTDDVRGYMETAGIYLFTSDFREGWGAVLNESMNSGCAVIASHAIGSVPFLVKHRENGLIYKNGDVDNLYNQVKYLLDYPDEQRRLGKNAYYAIVGLWNAEVAAERFLKLAEEIEDHGCCNLYEDGPCSKAPIIRNSWFHG